MEKRTLNPQASSKKKTLYRSALPSLEVRTDSCCLTDPRLQKNVPQRARTEEQPLIHTRLVPVAQYVRMSTDEQRYSIANQKAAIADYARQNGFEIIHTYEDPGESGLQLKHRRGLRQLLADVVNGTAEYTKIIVLDVSRWGRFQDADEGAHYEFVCKRAGIQVVYCAESFDNEGTLSDYLAKILKRTSAAEYSRELSIKSFENQKRTVQLGFRVGAQPGYGYRRMAVSSGGQHKGILETAELKALMSDRVTLVHGPDEEVQCVRMIFKLCLRGKSCAEIACTLNRKRVKKAGKDWKSWMVDDIVTNPKYAGTYAWNRTTQKLHSPGRRNKRDDWILKANAFPAIVSQSAFNKAQLRVQQGSHWSDQELLQKLRQLLARKGDLSERLIGKSRGMPALATYYRRFGTFEGIYKRAGFAPAPGRFVRSISRQRTQGLRAGLFTQIVALFPGRTGVFRLSGKSRQILRLDGRELSILLCPSVHRDGRARSWHLIPVPSESQYMTLVCKLNSTNDGFHSFLLFPKIDRVRVTNFTEQYPWLLHGKPVGSLEDLCDVAGRLR
jgi:DNA invertase Pin-like site-specific DNA recombinase